MATAARKVVTVLFCDVVEFTTMGEELDPERLRVVMTRFFEEMEAVLVGHGATVEKFIGDEVMAVFGVPAVHEDDALRAVRAAMAMTERLELLNADLEATLGVRLEIRVGVNTGEVVVGDHARGHGFVTGDAVNVAKRLETAADPGQILIGTATYPLVRHAVRAGPAQSFHVKGKADPVSSLRLDAVAADAAVRARTLDTQLVGREAELDRLLAELDAAEQARAARLVTVLGEAGLGKSRLARELGIRAAGRARVLTGRCLSYGDGITFWPLREIVAGAGGPETLADVLEDDDGALVLERVRGAIGSGGAEAGGEETFWAVRRLVEALARERPLVLCLEDVHWAEPTFLELLEYLAGWIRDAPVLLLCLARPELAEEQPGWAGLRPGSVLELPPLTDEESAALVAGLGGEASFDAATLARITAASEGNPLFAEQLAALVAEEPATPDAIPPTLHALLAARLDRLAPEERAVLERAAVMGREFWRRAVVDLTPEPERAHAVSRLHALVRRDLIRPDPAAGAEDGFRFGHVLIRDAAYAAIPKEARAELHERFAGWIEATAGARAREVEEIVGYHLEQAFRHREQLGPVDERARALAGRAGDLLGRAGRRAYSRQDMPAAANLLDRALALATGTEPARLELQRQLSGACWSLGEVARAEALLDGTIEAAAAAGDRRMELLGVLDRLERRQHAAPAELLAAAEEAVAVFEAAGDDAGLARAWRRIGSAHHMQQHYAEAERAAERSLRHAEAAQDFPELARAIDLECIALLYGPTSAERGVARCEELHARAEGRPVAGANVAAALAGLTAMRGDFARARTCAADAAQVYDALGLRLAAAGLAHVAAQVELLAGRPAAAAGLLRAHLDALPERVRAVHGVHLAGALVQGGELDEARELVRSGAAVARGFLGQRIRVDIVSARLDVRDGAAESALALAAEAVALAERTDALDLHADALLALAEAQEAAGLGGDALASTRNALELYERKGNLVAAERVSALLAPAA